MRGAFASLILPLAGFFLGTLHTVAVAQLSSIDVTIRNVQLTYGNVGELSLAEIDQLEALMKGWFEDFYSIDNERRQLDEGEGGGGRALQRDLVRNMRTTMSILAQDVAVASNTITFDQQMQYEALEGAEEPEYYLTLPYRNIIANGQLG